MVTLGGYPSSCIFLFALCAIGKVRQHGGDARCTRFLACVDDEKQLHDVVVNRLGLRICSGLDDEHIVVSYGDGQVGSNLVSSKMGECQGGERYV